MIYRSGEHVAQDYSRAVTLFEQACDGGSASSCNSLGLMYERGEGVIQDHSRALTLYQDVCDRGYLLAC